jgi:hypothetical protein
MIGPHPAWAACLLLAGTLAACSGSGRVRPDRLASDRLEALARGHADDPAYVVRLNPPPCDCPPFELKLDGRFYRVFLEPATPDGPAAEARTALETALGRGDAAATLTVVGRLSKGVRQAPSHQPCLVLKVTALCGPEGCPKK